MKLYISVLAVLLAGCSSANFPQKDPLTEEEQKNLNCAEIIQDMKSTQMILDTLNSGSAQGASAIGLGSSVLLAGFGSFNTGLIGTPIAHSIALNKTTTRLEQLQALFEEKDCEQEQIEEVESQELQGDEDHVDTNALSEE